MEVLGNHVIRFVTLYSGDMCLLTKPFLEVQQEAHHMGDETCITGCCRTTEHMRAYMKRIHNNNIAGEVMRCGQRASAVLPDVQTYYPHREETDG